MHDRCARRGGRPDRFLGLSRLRRASRTHLRGIDRYFIGPLSADELGAVGRSLGTIVDVLREPEGARPAATDAIDAEAARA